MTQNGHSNQLAASLTMLKLAALNFCRKFNAAKSLDTKFVAKFNHLAACLDWDRLVITSNDSHCK